MSDLNNKANNNLLDGKFDYSVMSSFMSYPLIDVTQRFVSSQNRFTFPAEVLLKNYKSKELLEKNRRRIDFIMVSRELAKKCVNSSVHNDKETGLLSDHYPVVAEFKLN